MNLSLLKKGFYTATLALTATTTYFAFAQASSANVVAGRDYTVLNQPQTPNPTVSMAMSFACSHCADFTRVYKVPEKIEQMLKATYPGTGEYLEWHIVFNDIQMYRDFARLRSVLYVTKNDKLLPAAFELPYQYRNDPQPLKNWLATNLNIDADAVNKLWNSPSVNVFYNKQEELTKQYDIRQTPTFIINGRYELNLASISIPVANPTPDQIGDAVTAKIKEILEATTK
ncbi:hypothetical protein CJP74_03065 [Psittacicella melopsittaci]|uniref:Thiol:disulfide interchange protein n=1 Tax=Psittacicella melopsittaci TaxID=2028576 RepID=A0A3A1Y6P2_9GAMM|nr:DsbA family protein [Psittacicella melopsittaci]RIY32976.1 hypothetical protein CJP74_03065 [Psittacicella melopsittaci]